MKSPKNKWNEISNLVLNPRSKDVKVDTYSSLILDVLFDEKDRQFTLQQILKKIQIKFLLENISPLILDDTLKYLVSHDIIANHDSFYNITEKTYSIMCGQKNQINQTYDQMLNSLGKEVSEILGMKLDRYQLSLIRKAFERSLYEIFETISQNTLNFLTQGNDSTGTSSLQKIIIKNSKGIREPVIENAKKILDVLPDAVYNIFTDPTEEFSKGLLMLSNKHLMWRVLGTSPELSTLRDDIFSEMALLLDTNIIIACLCEGSTRHKQTNWILDTTKSFGIKLLISDKTIKEFQDSLNHADYLYHKYTGKGLNSQILNNEITSTFYTNTKKYADWIEFITILSEKFASLLKNESVVKLNTSDFDVDGEKLDKIVNIIKGTDHEYFKERPIALAKHDATNILIIQALREETGLAFTSHWYLTHHALLLEIDEIIKELYTYDQVSCISCDTWFELIYPFIWANTDQTKDVATVFTQIVASNVLTIRTASVEAFLGYVAGELDLSDEDHEKIKRIIRESHLRRVLEGALHHKEISVPLKILREMIGDSLTAQIKVEKLESVIERLTKKISESQTDIEICAFDHNEFTEKIAEIENAKTNDQKKKTLEDFADYLISMINGWTTISKDVNLEAEEIDLIIQNKLGGKKWGDPILIECKNWSKPVGASQITVFLDKIKKLGASVGLLIATNGITGTEKTDAKLKVREALSGDRVRIIVLTLNDFKGITDEDQIIPLLNFRYYMPSKI